MRRSESRARRTGVVALLAALLWAHAARGVELDGGVTWVGLYADDAAIRDDGTLSVDLTILHPTQRGQWFAYVEGNSSLNERRASSVLPESNADAGTALDEDRRGRVQLSEFNYRLRLDERTLTLGMLDASSYLDRTRITNDENVQFLAASFVNNPTIEFPDYTLGVVYQQPGAGRRPQLNAVLTASNGLADNPNVSYSQLLRLTDDDKGAFAAVGLGWPSQDRLIRVGVWLNTRSHLDIDGTHDGHDNYGFYGVFGRSWGDHALNLRVGAASEEVTLGSRFASLAYRYRFRDHAVGLGVARAFLSEEVSDPLLADTSHVELFGRWAVTRDIHLTLSGQRIRHSGFHAGASDPRRAVALAGLRFHYAF